MALLDLISNVALEIGLSAPASVIGSNDKQVKRLLALANRAGISMADNYPWPQLQKEYTFALIASQDSYPLPGDFNFQQFATQWDRTKHWELVGPVTSEWWQWRKSGISQTTPRKEFRVKGATSNQIFIHPTPDASAAGGILVTEYVSSNWARPKTWAASVTYAANTYTFYNGNFYLTIGGGTTGATPPTHTTGSVSDGGVTWAFYNGIYERFTTDQDETILPQDLIELDTIWRWLRMHGQPFQAQMIEANNQIKIAYGKLAGAMPIPLGGYGRPYLIGPWNIPDTGFGT